MPSEKKKKQNKRNIFFSLIVISISSHHLIFPFYRENSTNQNQNGEILCSRVNNDVVEIDLRWACDGNGLIQWCPPLFISVEGPAQHDGLQANLRCVDRECRFPDNARFQINSENLGCWSGVGHVVASLGLILISIIMTVRV